MEAVAISRYLRIPPRKFRLVLDLIRGKHVDAARSILSSSTRNGAVFASKVLESAAANARVLKMDETRLFVVDVRADDAPRLKRYMPRSMGRADRIIKRSSHLTIHLREGKPKPTKKIAEPEVKAAVKPKRKKKAVGDK